MQIRCEECGTVYNFPDDKVSAQGTPVKCKVCGHVFVVHPGGVTVAHHTEPAPETAVAAPAAAAPAAEPAKEVAPPAVTPARAAERADGSPPPDPAWTGSAFPGLDDAAEIRRLSDRIPQNAFKFALALLISIGTFVVGYVIYVYTDQALDVYEKVDQQLAVGDDLTRKLERKTHEQGPADLVLDARAAIDRATPADYEDAVRLLGAALDRDPNRADAHGELAEALASLAVEREDASVLPAARKSADLAARLAPSDVIGPRAAAAVAFAAGDLDLADREIAKARARADNDARTHLLQAKVYLKRNLPEQAVESLAAALAANPLLVEANFLLAQLHGNRREWDKAERYAEAARTANPNHEAVRAYLRVVQEQRRTRDNPAAADEPARAAGLRPAPREYVQPSPLQQREGFDSLMKAATELVRRGELWEAVGKYRKAIELSPASCEAHVALGRTYYDLNQTPAAIETFNDAISANRRCASAYLGLASIQQDQGQKSLAVANYEQFLRLSPGGPDAAEVRSILDNLRRNP